jgi:CheY-like chemotaxis protein
LFAGQKLLVADDSPYYRTVIGLTFTDEGMEVTTVSDGQAALEQLEQSTPDVILTNAYMPGISGYELCGLIKRSERFGRIPVMLLVGAHESVDQAEARRVGADDVVTKPFKSIRQLVDRVGSLLGGKPAETEDTVHEYSTLGLGRADNLPPAVLDNEMMTDTNIPVFVEAASLAEPEQSEEAIDAAGSTCVAEVALQTADTQQLVRIDDEPGSEAVEPISYAQDDTKELAPLIETEERLDSPPVSAEPEEQIRSTGVTQMNQEQNAQTPPLPSSGVFNDALLDLGDFDTSAQRAVAEDLILDLDYEEPVSAAEVTVLETVTEPQATFDAAPAVELIAPEPPPEEQPVVEPQEWAVFAAAPAETSSPLSATEDQSSIDPRVELSSETIDAIARRVVDQMSEKVVREIAWEVVPELAELLIKKKLEDQK